jgi:hypothetical protein
MPRTAARHSRKVAVRLTSITACQSSSDIRITSPSRVMPALFTRMSTDPIAAAARLTSASTSAASDRLQGSTWARPPRLRRQRLQAAQPGCPTGPTTAPAPCKARAIAAPMPPEAPVTSAVLPGQIEHLSPSCPGFLRNISGGSGGRSAVEKSQPLILKAPARAAATSSGVPMLRVCNRALDDALDHPRQRLAGADLPILGDARPFHPQHDSRQRTDPVTCATSRSRMRSAPSPPRRARSPPPAPPADGSPPRPAPRPSRAAAGCIRRNGRAR